MQNISPIYTLRFRCYVIEGTRPEASLSSGGVGKNPLTEISLPSVGDADRAYRQLIIARN
jgi:hypothetical protein